MSATVYMAHNSTGTPGTATALTVFSYSDRKIVINSLKITTLAQSNVEDVLGYYKSLTVKFPPSLIIDPTYRSYIDAFLKAKHRWASIYSNGAWGDYSDAAGGPYRLIKSVHTSDEFELSVESMMSDGITLQSEKIY